MHDQTWQLAKLPKSYENPMEQMGLLSERNMMVLRDTRPN